MDNIMKYYSLVGERAIPVCMPIYFFLKKDYCKAAEVTLIHTPQTREVAERSESFLKREFDKRVRTGLVSYSDFIEHLKAESLDATAAINLTPGMAWQVAEMVLHLPADITCINMDYRYIYRYMLKDGIDSAIPVKIKKNLRSKTTVS